MGEVNLHTACDIVCVDAPGYVARSQLMYIYHLSVCLLSLASVYLSANPLLDVMFSTSANCI